VQGEDLVRLNRLLLRDGFAGIIADIPKVAPRLFPDYRAHFDKRFVELIKRKAYAAKPMHRNVIVGSRSLAELFDNPEELVRILATSDLIDSKHPRSSRFFEALSFSGPMYKIFTEDEKAVILDWIESLQKREEPVEPIPAPSPQEAAAKILRFIRDNAERAGAQQRHAQYQVKGRSLKDWFTDPEGLMAAFAASPEWVVPHNSAASRLYQEFATGRMSGIFDSVVTEDLRQWIDTGAELVTSDTVPENGATPAAAVPLRRHPAVRPFAMEVLPATITVAVAPAVTLARSDFATKRKLIGMGSVH
jgi:hypothetical protein